MLETLFQIALTNIEGKPLTMADFKGQVVMVVNVASKCGFTPQYEGLQKLYLKYKDKGFVILGFPANNFMWQEPASDSEIASFCSLKYNVTFPMFSKISVKGKDKHALYQYLTDKKTDPQFAGEVGWNFTKFLIGKDGQVINRFEPAVTPEDPKLVEAVEKALGL